MVWILNNKDEEAYKRFKDERSLDLTITIPVELTLCLGKGFQKDYVGPLNYLHFYNHLRFADHLYIIGYNLDDRWENEKNILRKVIEINKERKDGLLEEKIWPGIITSFRQFGDFSEMREQVAENVFRRKDNIANHLSTHLSDRMKALINLFTPADRGEELDGFYFYPGVHAKVYFTERLAYIGSSNLTNSRSNVEAGITTKSKEIIAILKSYYLALYNQSVRLDNIEMPSSQRHINDLV